MRFQQIIEAVYFNAWSITDAGWKDIHRIVSPHILGQDLPAHVQRFIDRAMLPKETALAGAETEPAAGKVVSEDGPDTDFFGEPLEKFQLTPDGLAIIPVVGPLINHASLIDRMCGACSYQQIQADLLKAQSSPGLKRVVFKISSPGGMCNGMAETCKAILKLRSTGIPMKAISDTLVGSAAYGIAVCCGEIQITETTMIGSVGSFSAVLDSRKAYELEGLLVQVFKSGEFKGAGMPGTSLSADQKAEYQRRSDYFGEQFRELVRSTRTIDEALLQGQVFIGNDAVEKGFADAVIEDIGSGFGGNGYEDDDEE